jgi:hypothetical protein
MRSLRNRLVHEYMTDPAKFAQDLVLAKEYSLVLIVTFNGLLQDLNKRMNYNNEKLPQKLILPELL